MQSPTDDTAAASAVPVQTTFGTFKPVGHVLIGIAGEDNARALKSELAHAGYAEISPLWDAPGESVAGFQRMIEEAGPLAGFGSEITKLRRYVELSESGHHWLLVKSEDDDKAHAIGDIAQRCGATLAVRYGTLVVEDLI